MYMFLHAYEMYMYMHMYVPENLFYRIETEKKLLQNIENVLHLIQDDTFWSKFGCILEKTHPGIKEILRDRIQDLEKLDCGIVVAGNVNDYAI